MPDPVAGGIVVGREQRASGDLDGAIATFTAMHADHPDDARPLVQRGAVFVLVGRYDEALADYDAARQRDPEYPGLDSYVAQAYLYTGRAAEALAVSQSAAAAEPQDLMHRINIAHAHLLLGDIGTALSCYGTVVDRWHPTKRQSGRQLVDTT